MVFDHQYGWTDIEPKVPWRNPPTERVAGFARMCRIERGLEAIGVGFVQLGLMNAVADCRQNNLRGERQGSDDGPRRQRAVVGPIGNAAPGVIESDVAVCRV